jgi:hypothetical protein
MSDNTDLSILDSFAGDDGFATVASPSPDNFPTSYLRFKKGTFVLADGATVPVGTAFLALAATELWMRLERDQKPVRVLREGDNPLPSRPELGDNDPDLWPAFDGKPSDPWARTYELMLVEEQSGRPIIFSTSSYTGRSEIENLCRLITIERRTRGSKARPIVKIGCGVWNSRRGPVAVPKFDIRGWVGEEDVPELPPTKLQADLTEILEKRSVIAAPAAPRSGKHKKVEPPPWDSDDLDDAIPENL